MEKGSITVSTENIFPIIKKFLYSEQEIFLRELVSNAVDATTKLKKLADLGEIKGDLGELYIEIKLNKPSRTLTISDRGIGMTADEVKRYINTIALSSAEEFIKKFESADKSTIIGHFGLGFYSAFMVADRVEIFTKSYKDEPGVHWSCAGTTEFELKPFNKPGRGTDVVLHISKEAEEFLDENKIRQTLKKYCRFLPVEIRFGTKEIESQDLKDKDGKPLKQIVPDVINNTQPAYIKSPSELKDEDYISFYEELYPFSEAPLFWIHLNTDYPFNLKGILYFPKIKPFADISRNKIHLYCNQVFVTDSIEQIVPDFLTLLHGVIDSPDIPLNVSRSYLQGDPNVKKISQHIVKKVSDKLFEIFKQDRTNFQSKWENLGTFIKYGMISDDKFYDSAIKFCLFQNIRNEYFTYDEIKEKTSVLQKDKHGKIVWLYTTDKELQHSYIQSAQQHGYEVLILDNFIDQHFIQHIEFKQSEVVFKRVDADTIDKLIEKENSFSSVLTAQEEEKIKKLFTDVVQNNKVSIDVKPLSPEELPVQIIRSEFFRRMADMNKFSSIGSGLQNDFNDMYNVVINANHAVIGALAKTDNGKEKARQLYDLALLAQGMLKGQSLTDFIKRSVQQLS
ncbi:MAG: molecular chaperone HtpG [Chitinophagales bacterium]|nr:molecular chaperone HtpG [Chitinophagales bacterium]MDW8274648.1 molecular chaperone HtpG [Chitinophagales bacterium]